MTVLQEARHLADALARCELRVVFAESCTAGLVSATLARVPGISRWHCGSAVTYREPTKHQWLGVSQQALARFSAVSEPVARQMAQGVLQKTPEADFAAAVTGHLGPGAPAELDGIIYIAIARRQQRRVITLRVWCEKLQERTRCRRQPEAATLVLRRLRETLPG